MKNLTPLIIEALIIVGIYLLALAAALPLRRGWRREPGGPKTAAGGWGDLAARLAVPGWVLALTVALVFCARRLPETAGWIQAHAAPYETHLTAWYAFWLVVLVLNLVEGLAAQFFAWCGRPFPIPGLILSILRAVAIVAAVFAILRMVLGVNISPLLASTALVTAVVGFALQGVLGNLLAGMSLHITRSVLPGDWVALDQIEGEVLETNWRETRLRSVAGHILIIPNSSVASAIIHNMSRPTPLRRHKLAVGASYSDAPGEVIAALVESALAVPEVLREPAPTAFVTAYLDFGINYEVRFWTNRYHNRTPVEGDVGRMIWYQFKRRGIEIPFPMSDKLLNDFMAVVYHQRFQPPAAADNERCAADLMRSDFGARLFVDENGRPLLTEKDFQQVAPLLRRVRYTTGEILFRQGEPGGSCYVLLRGALHGRIEYEGGNHAYEFDLGPGEVFGEMSLMTGLPRTATIAVTVEAELIEIPPAAFAQMLALHDGIPEILARLVAERGQRNAAAYENLKSVARQEVIHDLKRENILSRFLRLLGRGSALKT